MNDKFTFDMGVWTEGHPLTLPDDIDGYVACLQAIGYGVGDSDIHYYGSQYEGILTVYKHESDGTYLLDVEPMQDDFREVYIPNFPSLLMFLKDFAHVFTTKTMQTDLSELRELVDRLFHAYHGHVSWEKCNQCASV